MQQHNGPESFFTQPKWETQGGNFYNVGSIHVDHETFDALATLVDMMETMTDDDDGRIDHDVSEFDEDDDTYTDE